MSLDSILEAVASGRLSTKAAEAQIKALMAEEDAASPTMSDVPEHDGIKGAIERLKKNVHIDEFIKKGSDVMHQLSENMHRPFDKMTLPAHLNELAFSSHNQGVESKLSLFRAFEVSKCSTMLANHVIGSQWFGVTIQETSELKDNRFTAVQLSEIAITKSHFNDNNLSLSRLSNLTVQDAQFNDNKIARSTLSDVSISEGEFTSNKVTKSALAQTMFNESRVTNTTFLGCDIKDCEFESCEIQGVTFENCTFNECTFSRVKLISLEKLVIRNQTVVGKTLHNCKTAEAFLEGLVNSVEERKPVSKGPAPVEVEVKEAPKAKTRAGAFVVKKAAATRTDVGTETASVEATQSAPESNVSSTFAADSETTSSPTT